MLHAVRDRLYRLQDRMSLAQQTSMVIGLVCLLGLGALAVRAANLSQQQMAERIEHEMAVTASTLADRLDKDMFERYRDIKVLSNMRPLERIWDGDPAVIRAVLNQLQDSLRDYAWIGFARPDGIVVAATRGVLEGESVSLRPWFRDGLRGPAVGDVHEAMLLARLIESSTTEQPRFVDISFPVYAADRRLLGVLGAHLAFSWAEGLRKAALASAAADDVWVLSAGGEILLGPDLGAQPFPPARFAAMARAGTGTFMDTRDGKDILTGFALGDGEQDYPGLGWIVLARQDAKVSFEAANILAARIIGLGGILLLASMALASWLAGRVSRPLVRLTAAAGEIGRDPRATMPRLRGNQEVMQLSGALRALIRRLTSAERLMVQSERKHAEDVAALRQLADTDPLTGLLNRRSFMAIADAALTSARGGAGIGILMADIDHFKAVNDTYGHAAGDAVIRHVATHIAAALRAHDQVARFGGEEFVVLLQDIDEAGMLALADRIRNAIGATSVAFEGRTIAVTVSFGAARAEPGDRDVDEAIERADLGLYQAKNSGRNRVALARREAGKVMA